MKLSKNQLIRDIALQRIENLFNLAINNIKSNPSLSHRYIEIAIKISQRTRVKIPRNLKYFICKSCHSLLYPWNNFSYKNITKKKSTYSGHMYDVW